MVVAQTIAWWTFRIFFIFFSARGRGRGSPGQQGGGGVGFFIENPRRGGVLPKGGAGARRPGGFLQGIGGGGAKSFFFRGRNVHQDERMLQLQHLERAFSIRKRRGPSVRNPSVFRESFCEERVSGFQEKGADPVISAVKTTGNPWCATDTGIPGVPRTPGLCPEDFLKFMCPFLS